MKIELVLFGNMLRRVSQWIKENDFDNPQLRCNLIEFVLGLDSAILDYHNTMFNQLDTEFINYLEDNSFNNLINICVSELITLLNEESHKIDTIDAFQILAKHSTYKIRNKAYKPFIQQLCNIINKMLPDFDINEVNFIYQESLPILINNFREIQVHIFKFIETVNIPTDSIFTILFLNKINFSFKKKMFFHYISKYDIESAELNFFVPLINNNIDVLTAQSNKFCENILETLFKRLSKEDTSSFNWNFLAEFMISFLNLKNKETIIFNNLHIFLSCFELLSVMENESFNESLELLINQSCDDLSKYSSTIIEILLRNIDTALSKQVYYITYNNIKVLHLVLKKIEQENESSYHDLTDNLIKLFESVNDTEIKLIIFSIFITMATETTSFNVFHLYSKKISDTIMQCDSKYLDEVIRFKAIEYYKVNFFFGITKDNLLDFRNYKFALTDETLQKDFECLSLSVIDFMKELQVIDNQEQYNTILEGFVCILQIYIYLKNDDKYFVDILSSTEQYLDKNNLSLQMTNFLFFFIGNIIHYNQDKVKDSIHLFSKQIQCLIDFQTDLTSLTVIQAKTVIVLKTTALSLMKTMNCNKDILFYYSKQLLESIHVYKEELQKNMKTSFLMDYFPLYKIDEFNYLVSVIDSIKINEYLLNDSIALNKLKELKEFRYVTVEQGLVIRKMLKINKNIQKMLSN